MYLISWNKTNKIYNQPYLTPYTPCRSTSSSISVRSRTNGRTPSTTSLQGHTRTSSKLSIPTTSSNWMINTTRLFIRSSRELWTPRSNCTSCTTWSLLWCPIVSSACSMSFSIWTIQISIVLRYSRIKRGSFPLWHDPS